MISWKLILPGYQTVSLSPFQKSFFDVTFCNNSSPKTSVDEHPFNSNQMYGQCSADPDRECPCGTNEYIPACATMPNGTKVTFFNPCHLGCNIIQLNQSARAVNSDNNLNTDEYQLENCRCTGKFPITRPSCFWCSM